MPVRNRHGSASIACSLAARLACMVLAGACTERHIHIIYLSGDAGTTDAAGNPAPAPSAGTPAAAEAVSSGAGGDGSAGGAIGIAPGAPTFGAIYREIIVGKGCNAGACHSGPAGGLSMRSKPIAYQSLVGVPAMGLSAQNREQSCASSGLERVVPGDPERSLFLQKIARTQTCGTAMPPTKQALPSEQVQQVRAWIANGAPDD